MTAINPITSQRYLLPPRDNQDQREELLALLQNDQVIPMTEDEEIICKRSQQTTQWANLCISWKGYCVGVGIPTILSLFSFNVFGFPKDESVDISLIITGLCVVGLSNAWSMYATGTATAKASEEQNKEQNVLNDIQTRFENLGKYMIAQYHVPREKQRMIACASQINIERIRSQINSTTTQNQKVTSSIRFLNHVIHYILNQDTSADSDLENLLTIYCNYHLTNLEITV